MLKISGIVETENEDCCEAVKKFFKEVMKIKEGIDLIDAHRIGKGSERSMMVYLANSRDKARIFSKVKSLKEVKMHWIKSITLMIR